MAVGRHLGCEPSGSSAIRSAIPKNPTTESNTKWIGRPVAEIWPFEIFKMAASCHLGFDRTGNSVVRSAVPENPTLETNMKLIGSPIAEIWQFEISNMATGHHLGFFLDLEVNGVIFFTFYDLFLCLGHCT